MFPAMMTRDHGQTRRILIVAIAALLTYATLAFAGTTPAEAHSVDIGVDCNGWQVTLGEPGGYKDYATNEVQIWIDGETEPSFENLDFGKTYSKAGSWDPTKDHQLRVRVLAGDLPQDSRYSFDTTWPQEACESGTTTTTTSPAGTSLTIVKKAIGGDGTFSFVAGGPGLPNFDLVTENGTDSETFGLSAGTYTIAEDLVKLDGWEFTSLVCQGGESSIAGAIATIDLAAGSSATCTFTNNKLEVKGTAQLGDTVWLDANKNGVQDNGEVGYNGADIILKDTGGNVVGTLTTATGAWVGFYKFVGLDAGTYVAMLDLSTIGTYKVSTPDSFTITLEEGDDYLDADFGLYEDTTPPTTTPPTTTPPTTTPPTTTPPTTTPPTTTPPEETLPDTGMESEGIAVLGIGLLLAGALAVLATRKRHVGDQ